MPPGPVSPEKRPGRAGRRRMQRVCQRNGRRRGGMRRSQPRSGGSQARPGVRLGAGPPVSAAPGAGMAVPGPAGEPVRVPGRAGEPVRVPGRAGEPVRVPGRAGEPVRVPGRAGEPVRVPGRAGEAASGPAGAAQLIPETVYPGLLSELADEFLADRLRGRSDCGGVHRVSEIPAARAVTAIPARRRHFPTSPYRRASGRALPAEAWTSDGTAGARVAREPTMKGPSLYDLDFFWMSRSNHCSLDKKLRPWRGGGPSGLKGYLASGRSAKPWRCASACLVP